MKQLIKLNQEFKAKKKNQLKQPNIKIKIN